MIINEAKEKEYTVVINRNGRETEVTRTLSGLIDYFGYTLEKGASWQHERGNKKIDQNPKTIKSLIINLNNAESNAARNGYSGTYYSLKG